ncbi:hypothetical protein BIFDEN_00586 [Bifidobacterium dentium ATCC 27678]|nr:hypothetical protein BIFDEN_00586 [Bifidobacterium dentium ATCC 27678]
MRGLRCRSARFADRSRSDAYAPPNVQAHWRHGIFTVEDSCRDAETQGVRDA